MNRMKKAPRHLQVSFVGKCSLGGLHNQQRHRQNFWTTIMSSESETYEELLEQERHEALPLHQIR
jgi:hypothetical protein